MTTTAAAATLTPATPDVAVGPRWVARILFLALAGLWAV